MMTSDEEQRALAAAGHAPEAAPNAATENPFAALGLAPALLDAVAALGFTAPTEVQRRAIPLALAEDDGGNDLLVSSQTGSGKTAAFLLPVLHTLVGLKAEAAAREQAAWDARVAEALARGEAAPKKPRRRNPLDRRNFRPATPGALVLAPTRELAQQVAADAVDLVRACRGLRIASVVGGMPYGEQIARLQNADLVVATPGRLLDLQKSGQIVLDQVRFLVVDEADRMLDLGFADDLEAIHQLTAGRRQTMMFSATLAAPIQRLALRVMREGGAHVQRLQVDAPEQRHDNIRQQLYWADSPEHKRRLLDYWLRDPSLDQAIVFACTQVECDQLAQELQQAGFAAVSLHGALSQGLRNRRLGALREGRVQILVATDVAARGIDVPTITHVINHGLPMKAEDYTHRIGRTGRAGRDGLAVTLAEFRDRRRLADIEAHTRQPFEPLQVDGLEPTKFFPPIAEPFVARRGGAPARRGGPGRPGADRSGEVRRGPKPVRHGFKAKSGSGGYPKSAGGYQKQSKPGAAPRHARTHAPRGGKAYAPSR